jgi:hypothetical protein
MNEVPHVESRVPADAPLERDAAVKLAVLTERFDGLVERVDR